MREFHVFIHVGSTADYNEKPRLRNETGPSPNQFTESREGSNRLRYQHPLTKVRIEQAMLDRTHITLLEQQRTQDSRGTDIAYKLESHHMVVFQVNRSQVAIALLLQNLVAFFQPNSHDRQAQVLK